MMTINLITFASHLHKQSTIYSSHEVILTELEKYFSLHFVNYEDMNSLKPDDFSLVFIASGGVERIVIQHFEQLPRPTVMLADGMQNSLAAALEISSWLRDRGMKSEILHGELTEVVKRIFVLYNNFKAQRRLYGSRIGVIGTPAPWLIASNVDYLLAKRRWGIEYIDIPIEHVTDLYEHVSEDEVGEESVVPVKSPGKCQTVKSLTGSLVFYGDIIALGGSRKILAFRAVKLECSGIAAVGFDRCLVRNKRIHSGSILFVENASAGILSGIAFTSRQCCKSCCSKHDIPKNPFHSILFFKLSIIKLLTASERCGQLQIKSSISRYHTADAAGTYISVLVASVAE